MNQIKNISILGLSAVIFVSGFFSFFYKSSAEKVSIEQWEYAVINSVYYIQPEKEKVNKIVGFADGCIMQVNECRQFEFKHELDYADFLQAAKLPETFQARIIASKKAGEIAFQKALARLGNDGWELIAEPKQEFKAVNLYYFERIENKSVLFTKDNTEAVYFKRLKNRTYNGKE